jgi:uncharacterized protein (TIGR03435 family)
MVSRFLISVCAAVALAEAQTAPPAPARPLAFEVASIKPAQELNAARLMSGQQRITVHEDAARVDFADISLAELIRSAYRVKLYQISGPDWISTTRFDVSAKLPDGAKTDQVPEMMQTLLAERFHLALHNASKEMAVYALVAGKDGPKLKESTAEDLAPGAATSGAADDRSPMSTSGPNGSAQVSAGPNGLHVEIKRMTIAGLIDWLSRFTDRPVVDLTGLTGRYDLGLDASREEMMNAARGAGMAVEGRRMSDRPPDPGGDSIAASLQKVGLKLESRRLPMTLLVVDHLDKTPTEN